MARREVRAQAGQQELVLRVFDVGHGDSLLIEFPDGITHGIVDCNYHRPFGRSHLPRDGQTSKALAHIRARVAAGETTRVAFACLTHPHIDHLRGFAALLRGITALKISVASYWDFGMSRRKAEALYRCARDPELKAEADEFLALIQVRDELRKLGTEYTPIVHPRKGFWRGCGITIDVLAPAAEHVESYSTYLSLAATHEKQAFLAARRCVTEAETKCRCPADDNIVASGLLIRYGKLRVLLGSDMTNCAWRQILTHQSRPKISCHVVKVSHHGSVEGSFPWPDRPLWPFLHAAGAATDAVISGGYRAGLPHERTIKSLTEARCRWYCTGNPYGKLETNPYHFPFVKDPLIRRRLQTCCFLSPPAELTNTTAPGRSGDVVIRGRRDGQVTIETEF